MKKTTKRYVLTTSALNCYLFRILTLGLDLSHYDKNPLLLWMHIRPKGLSVHEVLPMGRAVELRLEGDAITCALEFDDTDTFAMRIFNKYENGTLSMLSAGVKPIEWSDHPEHLVPGQIGPTVMKGILVEVSCVDIGGNPDALPCTLYDDDDNIINMADLSHDGLITLFNNLHLLNTEDNTSMKILTLSAPAANAILLQLKLGEAATEVEVQKAVADLVILSNSQATQISTLTDSKTDVDAKLVVAESKLAENLKLSQTAAVTALVDGAADALKILPGAKPDWVALANKDFEGTKKILDGMVGSKSISETLKDKDKDPWFAKLTYQDMDKSGTLLKLKGENLEVFKAKFLEHYKTEYKGA
jgi:hypothetical protein